LSRYQAVKRKLQMQKLPPGSDKMTRKSLLCLRFDKKKIRKVKEALDVHGGRMCLKIFFV
jgi:hypothetical protein